MIHFSAMICQLSEQTKWKLLAVMLAVSSACAGMAQEAAVVQVRVFEHDGEAAKGVRVWLRLPRGGRATQWAVAGRGLAVFSNVPAGRACVTVGLDIPFATAAQEQRVKVEAGRRTTAVLVVPAYGGLRVTACEGSAGGMSVKSWGVEIRQAGGDKTYGTSAAFHAGVINTEMYEWLPAGKYEVDVQFNNISVLQTTAVIRTKHTTEIDATPRTARRALAVRMRDADGRAVRGRVHIKASDDQSVRWYGEIPGACRIEPLDALRDYLLTFESGSTSITVKAAADGAPELEVRVPRSYRVTAEVRMADGAACTNALYLDDVPAVYSNGVAIFEQVFPVRHWLWYRPRNRVPWCRIVCVESNDVELSGLTICDEVVVRGRVVGEDVPDELGVESRRTATNTFVHAGYVDLDEDGRFELRGVLREGGVRLYDWRYGRQQVVLRAGPFEADHKEYDAGDVHLKAGMTPRRIKKIIGIVAVIMGVALLIPFVIYALAVRVWGAQEGTARWRVWDGVMVVMLFLLESLVLGALAVGLTGEDGSVVDVGALMWVLLGVNVLTLGYVAMLAWARRGRLSALLPWRGVAWRRAAVWIVLGVAGTQAVSIGFSLVLRACGVRVPMQEAMRLILGLDNAGEAVLTLVAGAVLVPVCEEIVFRGVIFGALWRRMALWAAVLISAMAFAIVHMELAYLLPVGVLGAVCAVSYARTQSLVIPAGIHVLNNLAAFGYVVWQLWRLG